jgi:YihY family inner membrane protein
VSNSSQAARITFNFSDGVPIMIPDDANATERERLQLRSRHKFYISAFATAGSNFIRDDCVTVSSSISFVFLLAIIPFTALFLFLLKMFQTLFLPELFPDNLVAVMVQDISMLIPFIPQGWLKTHLVDSVGVGSFTTINLVTLPLISGLLFKSLDQAFRRIFNLPKRSLIRGQAVYAAMSVFVILVFFMANFIWTLASDATSQLQQSIQHLPYVAHVYLVVLDYFSVPQVNIVSCFLLMLFFLATNEFFLSARKTRIQLPHRLVAGALFALLWIVARTCFGLYIQHVARINVLYGSLGSVCILLLWIFYSSVALLYSVEFMYVLHCGPYKIWAHDIRNRMAAANGR